MAPYSSMPRLRAVIEALFDWRRLGGEFLAPDVVRVLEERAYGEWLRRDRLLIAWGRRVVLLVRGVHDYWEAFEADGGPVERLLELLVQGERRWPGDVRLRIGTLIRQLRALGLTVDTWVEDDGVIGVAPRGGAVLAWGVHGWAALVDRVNIGRVRFEGSRRARLAAAKTIAEMFEVAVGGGGHILGTVTGYPAGFVWSVEALRTALSRILDVAPSCTFTVLTSSDSSEIEIVLRCDVEGAGRDYEVARTHFKRHGDLWLRVHDRSFRMLDSVNEFRVAGEVSIDEVLRGS